MKFIPALRATFIFAALGMVLPVFTPARAAADTTPPPAESSAPKPVPFSLEIRNGVIIENGKDTVPATIGNILDYMKKRNPDFSIVLGSGVADVRVSDLILHLPDFSPRDILKAVYFSADGVVVMEDLGAGIISLRLHDTPERGVQVFNLSSYLNSGTPILSPDATDKAISDKLHSLTDVIEKTLRDLAPDAPPSALPQFQFHQGSGLLVVTGTAQARDVANQVVNALTATPDDKSTPFAAPDNQVNLQNMVKNWSATDPAAAFKWAASLPTTDLRSMTDEQMQKELTEALAQLSSDSLKLENLVKQINELKPSQASDVAPSPPPAPKPPVQ